MANDKSFKDLFSQGAADYARYRPHYPPELFSNLALAAPDRALSWDCGTGSGQAAIALAAHFDKVVASDPSQKQLEQAVSHPKVQYQNWPAEKTELQNQSVSLITVAQALHWFRFDDFYKEVRRVAKPGCVLAVWSYALAKIDDDVDRAVLDFYEKDLAAYWEPERKLVDEGYMSLRLPIENEKRPNFAMKLEMNLASWLNYLSTWSALAKAKKLTGRDLLNEATPSIASAWGAPEKVKLVSWPLQIRMGRVKRDPSENF